MLPIMPIFIGMKWQISDTFFNVEQNNAKSFFDLRGQRFS